MAVKPIIIFGNKDLAEMAKFYFTQVGRRVAGFTMDNPESDTYKKLPMWDAETIHLDCPYTEYDMFAPIYSNITRQKIYERLLGLGYKLVNFVHETAHVWDPGMISKNQNVFIQEHNNIQYGTTIGDNNIFWAGNHIGHHSIIGAHNYFSSHVVLSGHCKVGNGNYFGVNCTIKDAMSIASGNFFGANSFISKNIDTDNTLYFGTPATPKGDAKKYM
jgi:acetyltransferase-like isoleucine patch superfamily enzyme